MRTWPTTEVLGAELLKVRKRWMPYVLFLVMVAGAAIQIWLAGFVSYQDPSEENVEFQLNALRTFSLPWSLTALLDMGQFWGAMLVGILAASVVATEHTWGTVRQALIRGQPRSQYLTAKLLGIIVIAATTLLLALGVGVWFSVAASALEGVPVTLDIPGGDGPSIPAIALMILRAGYGIVPYGLLAFCLAVVGRSTTLGVAGIMMFMFAEAITLAILGGVGGVAADMRALFLGHNVLALLAVNRIGGFRDYNAFSPRDRPLASDLPDPTVAALVLALYCLAFLAVAFWVFRRRDVHA